MNRHWFVLLVLAVLCCCTSPSLTVDAQDMGKVLTDMDQNPPLPKVAQQIRQDVSPSNKARMLVIGDSLADGFGQLLRQQAAARDLNIEVSNRGRTSSGLARSDFYDWPASYRSFATQLKPDIVVAHFGANDMQGVITPGGRTAYGTEAWEEAYRDQIRGILQIAHDTGGVLYWIGPGADARTNLHRHLTTLNDWIAEETKRAGAVYFPIRPFTSPPDGSFARTVNVAGTPMALRTADGSHFTGRGYQLVADRILDDLVRAYPQLSKTEEPTQLLAAARLQ